MRDVPLIPVPPLDIIGLSGVPAIEKEVDPRRGGFGPEGHSCIRSPF